MRLRGKNAVLVFTDTAGMKHELRATDFSFMADDVVIEEGSGETPRCPRCSYSGPPGGLCDVEMCDECAAKSYQRVARCATPEEAQQHADVLNRQPRGTCVRWGCGKERAPWRASDGGQLIGTAFCPEHQPKLIDDA